MADLVLLHGPPASGKLTIANEISKLVKARVFHNHLTLDVAKSLINFGDPGFWDLVYDLRLLSLRAYFEHGNDIAVTTWCYEEPDDIELFKQYKRIASATNARVLPVFLRCELSNLESRAANTHRLEMEKLSDKERLREVVLAKNYCAIPDELCITVDSNTETPESNAQRIVDRFRL
ncbi:MAG: hypothetical protein KTR35_24650 [Gammaproteobacteria bacterium]|nr:hypothetical protein [Gammaproteobacteria bacterium]